MEGDGSGNRMDGRHCDTNLAGGRMRLTAVNSRRRAGTQTATGRGRE